jgi:hypothetical protein
VPENLTNVQSHPLLAERCKPAAKAGMSAMVISAAIDKEHPMVSDLGFIQPKIALPLKAAIISC